MPEPPGRETTNGPHTSSVALRVTFLLKEKATLIHRTKNFQSKKYRKIYKIIIIPIDNFNFLRYNKAINKKHS